MPNADPLLDERRAADAGPEPDPGTGGDREPRRTDLAWRALVALAAIVLTLVVTPTGVVGGLTALALVLATERLARSRQENGADTVLVLVGGVMVSIVLAGVLLGSTPIGLSATSWAVGLDLVALAGLGVALLLPRPAPLSRGAWGVALRAAPWAVAVVAVAAIAIGISVRSIGPAEEPPLQMSFGQVDGAQVQVVVTSTDRVGPLELRTTDSDGNEISYPLFTVGAGQTYKADVAVPRDGRFKVSVNYPDQTQPLRSLLLDR